MRGPALRAVLGAALASCICAGAAAAVDSGTVARFVGLSDQFHARLPKSGIEGLSQAQRRVRAECILNRFEQAHGDEGVQALMGLMGVLSRGTQFDDPTVVAFNQRFGGTYDGTVRQCTQDAKSS